MVVLIKSILGNLFNKLMSEFGQEADFMENQGRINECIGIKI